MYSHRNILFFGLILLHACCHIQISSFPHKSANENDMEIITVAEVVHSVENTKAEAKNLTAPALITQNNEHIKGFDASSTSSALNDASNEPVIDTADELIFLVERPQPNDEQRTQLQTVTVTVTEKAETTTAVNKGTKAETESKASTSTTTTTTMMASTVGIFQQIDLLTSAEEDSLTAITKSAAIAETSTQNDNVAKKDDDNNDGVGDGNSNDGVVTTPQNELNTKYVGTDTKRTHQLINDNSKQTDEIVKTHTDDDDVCDVNVGATDDVLHVDVDVDDDVDVDVDDIIDDARYNNDGVKIHQNRTSIDLSDFVALIPSGQVKSIVTNYYRNDPEVQRAYVYLSSPDFLLLRHHIIILPEVQEFLNYLNRSGLDVISFFHTLSNLTTQADELTHDDNIADIGSGSGSDDALIGNEIENGFKFSQVTTNVPRMQYGETTTTPEQLNGIHGLVDSVLDTLPQDQILSTFFEKLETNENFSKLVDSIGRPAFARILHNLQNSVQLRAMVFTMHNHGIYIARIVDSLKAYFFLGTF